MILHDFDCCRDGLTVEYILLYVRTMKLQSNLTNALNLSREVFHFNARLPSFFVFGKWDSCQARQDETVSLESETVSLTHSRNGAPNHGSSTLK